MAVGCGVASSGVTVAVGRGPAGMLGLGMGVAVSLGEPARTPDARISAATIPISMRNRIIVTVSRPARAADVIHDGNAPSQRRRDRAIAQVNIVVFREGKRNRSFVRPPNLTQ